MSNIPIKSAIDDSGAFYPESHERAITDDNGTTLESKLQKVKNPVLTLNSAPTSSTLTHTEGGVTYTFKVGDEVRVHDTEKGTAEGNYFVFYTLKDKSNNTAYWEESGSGGGSATITGTIVVNLEEYINNSKTAGSGLVGAVITLTNTSDSETVGTHTIVSGETGYTFSGLTPMKNYSISVSALSGYTQPEAQTVSELGIGTSVTKTFQYEADEYTIAITSDQGASDPAISEAVVTINGTDYENGDTIKFATGTSQSDIESAISVTSVSGYGNTFAVNTTNHTITSSYTKIILGVFAYYSDGTLKTEEEADSNAIGVAVLTANAKFIIDKTDALNTTTSYGGNNKDLSATAVTTSTQATAQADYRGEQNTTNIINACAGYNDGNVTGAAAAVACRAKFGGLGYMGALGEWQEAYNNKAAVDSMMTKIGGTAIILNYYWTSTHANASERSWGLSWGGSDLSGSRRSGNGYVRAFLPYYNVKLHLTGNDNVGAILEVTKDGVVRYAVSDSNGDVNLSLGDGTYTVTSFSHSLSVNTITVDGVLNLNISATKMEYVDLGLSSGVKWATCNLGADTPTETGDYFSWGNIEGHAADSGYSFDQTTYNSTPGASLTASISSSDATHDAALAIKGSPWRMPSNTDASELISNTINEIITIDGKKCMKLTSTINGKTILFRLSGIWDATEPRDIDSKLMLWQSTRYTTSTMAYRIVYTNTQSLTANNGSARYNGQPIRPVQ